MGGAQRKSVAFISIHSLILSVMRFLTWQYLFLAFFLTTRTKTAWYL
jgi:hypothetical protein